MNAGRELDALIAEKVMGLCVHEWEYTTLDEFMDDWMAKCDKCNIETSGGSREMCPASGHTQPYSTDIAAAWTVVEKLRCAWDFSLQVFAEEGGTGACFTVMGETFRSDGSHMFSAEADTAPLAICLAALKAVA